jgi:hypothetical protein
MVRGGRGEYVKIHEKINCGASKKESSCLMAVNPILTIYFTYQYVCFFPKLIIMCLIDNCERENVCWVVINIP